MTELKAIQRHPFHLVDSSPWPLLAGQSALALTTGFVMYLQCYQGGAYVFMFGFILVPAPQLTSRSVGVSPSRCARPSPRSPAPTSTRMFARPPSL